MNIDLEELAAIIEQLDKTDFTDFRYEHGDLRIQVRRGGYYDDAPAAARQPAAVPAAAPEAGTAAPAPAVPAVPAAASAPASSSITAANLPDGHIAVTAPMLGTFYSAPKPGEPAFVKVGDVVDADSVLCIVEVMKLMNSVSAGAAGEVSAVFVNDGDLVEFEQPLFAIKATA
ncbi:acetyl-CoA carboxylase biotin carboxyl carrier protein [Arthrobacter sp. I2-34]|uniref:Biotin carboxyl carrier protein of acetyl-CoA carboxylase n=1 Tax=Arthrobacter hankyongi TaxID=2904801 RepID=A0ABS9L3K3_9MICC|nr:acetyl-CoA carboxylase biotin carboxyl carrier protein [Arthrobacter hankyongi]MCG2621186.1 acetyl-CoA carboxylase biotin carboxyl carrier protein [Arthrobacter hankyongi]